METYINNYLKELLNLTLQMSPYLILGFLFAGILHVLFPRNKVARYLGKNNLRSVIYSSLIGIPLPLCSCGVIPTSVSLYKNGASKGSTVSFLTSTPQTGMDSIFATYSLLGLPMAIARPFIALATGIIGGLFTNLTERNQPSQTINNEQIAEDLKKETKPKWHNAIAEMFRYAFIEFLSDLAKWLVIGLMLAALISVLIPDAFITRYVGNEFLSMLVSLAMAGPLYVCATGSIPIAAVLMIKGLTPGAAIVFLMAGPATNAATITVIGKVLGKRTLFTYLVSIILGSLFFGLFIDYFLPREWFTYAIHNIHHGGHAHEMFPGWVGYASAMFLTLFILNALVKRYIFDPIKFRKANQNKAAMNQVTIKIEGMTCNHCKMNIENKISAIKGIKEVQVDLASSLAKITGDQLDLEKIRQNVESIGYKYAGVIANTQQ
jgi:uncharacterized membrane protein YraQ (UPF0718 family)/copper chaperone CopZ